MTSPVSSGAVAVGLGVWGSPAVVVCVDSGCSDSESGGIGRLDAGERLREGPGSEIVSIW